MHGFKARLLLGSGGALLVEGFEFFFFAEAVRGGTCAFIEEAAIFPHVHDFDHGGVACGLGVGKGVLDVVVASVALGTFNGLTDFSVVGDGRDFDFKVFAAALVADDEFVGHVFGRVFAHAEEHGEDAVDEGVAVRDEEGHGGREGEDFFSFPRINFRCGHLAVYR